MLRQIASARSLAGTVIAVLGLGLAAPSHAQTPDLCPAGNEAMANEDPEAAVTAFRACLAAQLYEWPQEADLRIRLAGSLLSVGEDAEALLVYNQVFALIEANGGNTDNAFIRRSRAFAFLRLEQTENALADLERAIASEPGDAFTHVLIGSALIDLDQHAEAVAAFDRAVRLEPDYAQAWAGRSAAFVEMGLFEHGVDDAEEAVGLAPEDGSTLNALCWALVQAGRAADGLSICDAAVEAEPDNGNIIHSRAAALEQVGRLDEAAALYAQAYALLPDDPEIRADHERVNGP